MASLQTLQEEPLSRTERPARARKIVERYSSPEPGRSAAKPLSIDKGRGTQLKDIPNVAFKLSKRKPDDNMQTLHMILFGKRGKAHNMKKNIGQFSGYVWVENEEKQKAKVREKLDKCIKEKLMDFCDVLNIPINKANVRKEELTVKILDFLESPHATTEVLLAEKEQKAKKRKSSMPKSANLEDATVTPAKKQKKTPLSGEKQKHASKGEEDEEEEEDKVKSPDFKNDSEEDGERDTVPKEESDHEGRKSDDEEQKEKETEKGDEQKNQVSTKKSSSKKTVKKSSGVKNKDKNKNKQSSGKSTPAKPDKTPKSTKKSSTSSLKRGADTDGTSGSKQKSKASSKKQKVDKENSKDHDNSAKEKVTSKKQSGKALAKTSTKDQGKSKSSKKTKAEPTREELHVVVGQILKKVDFNTATLSDILKGLGDHFGIDLLHRKAEVKDIITEVINDMSDESEAEEADEKAEAGDDGEDDD